jgi:hypothetical protein
MIKTLGMFLSSKERKMSRVVSGLMDEGALYEPDLYVQGIILVNACYIRVQSCLHIELESGEGEGGTKTKNVEYEMCWVDTIKRAATQPSNQLIIPFRFCDSSLAN